MDPDTEDVISGYIDRGPAGTSVSMPAPVAHRVASAVSSAAEPLVAAGHELLILTAPSIRAQLRQILEPHLPDCVVLSYNEVISGVDVESLGLVQLDAAERSEPATTPPGQSQKQSPSHVGV